MKKSARKPRKTPYAELGDLLRDWRRKRYRSALSMFKEAKLPISYKVYADFECGATLPSVPTLLSLAKFFHEEPKVALFIWAAVQMSTTEHKKLFLEALRSEPKPKPTPVAPAPRSFENTWTLGSRDRDLLIKDPWLWDVICALSVAYPNEVRHTDLPGSKNKNAIRPWIEDGNILQSKTGLKLKHPHVHIPKTADWNPVRVNNVSQAANALLKRVTPQLMEKGEAFRGLIDRGLNAELARQWCERMKELENEFIALQEKAGEQATTPYTLLTLFGPNRLKP